MLDGKGLYYSRKRSNEILVLGIVGYYDIIVGIETKEGDLVMSDVSVLIKNAVQLYEDLMYQNAKDFKEIRQKGFADVKTYLKQRMENNNEKYIDGYAYALDWVNIISPRYYIQGVDITLAMREKLYLSDEAKSNESWELVKEALREYEIECFKEYVSCIIGVPSKPNSAYDEYVKCVRNMNEFLGVLDAEEPQIENVRAFRTLVKQTVLARKKCQVIVSFTTKVIPVEKRTAYNKTTLTFEEALDICDDIIGNIEKIAYAKKGQSLVDVGVDNEDVIDMLAVGGVNDEEAPKGVKAQILENFPTNFVEQCGVGRRSYNDYIGKDGYEPYKKLCIAVGLFVEPYADLSSSHSSNSCIMENLECFMNQNSFSINSKFATITEYDVLMDENLRYMLEDGLSLDVIAFMLKTFAGTYKDHK